VLSPIVIPTIVQIRPQLGQEPGGGHHQAHMTVPRVPGACFVAGLRWTVETCLRSSLRSSFVLAWSAWRQRHQFGAAEAHYRAHETQL
jgi:hypothetical protein